MAREPEQANPAPPVGDPPVREAILKLCAGAGPGRSVDPAAVARELGGKPGETVPWRALIRRIRAEAARLQDEGAIVVLRKGRPVDIRSAKGVIRLALAAGQQDGAGWPAAQS